jgi:hypothetical protein
MRSHEFDVEPVARKAHPPQPADEPALFLSASIAARPPAIAGAGGLLHMQRLAGNSAATTLVTQRDEEESPVKGVIQSAGAGLDAATRADMEARLGHDFGDVQVHTDAKAADSARSVQAHAYTVGNHVVFGEGNYQPGSDAGRRTLAHELTHVVQQRSGPVDGTPAPGGVSISHPSDRFEQEAERSADLALRQPADSLQGLFVQRQEAGEQEEEEPVQALGLGVQREEAPEEDEEPAAG